MLRTLWASLLAMALPSSACFADGAFECQASTQCDGGQCFDGYCGFADGDCPSGFVYGEHAPSELAKTCVPPAADDTTGANASSTVTITTATQTTEDSSAPESTGPQPVTAESSTTSDSAESTTDRSETTTTASGSETTGPAVQRIEEGIIALYQFADGPQQDEIADLSAVEPLVPLTIVAVEGSPSWTDDGLHFSGGGIAVAMGSSTKIRERLELASAFTLEIWTTPTELIQVGPPRLMTLSLDPSVRSFSLTHGGTDPPDGVGLPMGDQYGLRLRSADHLDPNGVPTILTDSIAQLAPTHVVATRDLDGLATIWVDGEALVSEVRSGGFDVWLDTHVFAVGNEIDLSRGYAGTIHLAAIYERALDAAEIATNRDAGY